MAKFRKRPVEVYAFQLTENFFKPWIKDREQNFRPVLRSDNSVAHITSYRKVIDETMYIVVRRSSCTLFIKTLEGDMRCRLGDWIITGVKGEVYACRQDIFEKTYEPV